MSPSLNKVDLFCTRLICNGYIHEACVPEHEPNLLFVGRWKSTNTSEVRFILVRVKTNKQIQKAASAVMQVTAIFVTTAQTEKT